MITTESKPTLREVFGFSDDPFTVDPAKLWLDDARRETVEQLHDVVARRSFAVLTGPSGAGKTVLLGHLCSRLNPNHHQVIYIACPECGPTDFLRQLCGGLCLEPTLGKSRMIQRIHDHVADSNSNRPVVIVDEAQGLPQSTFETLRITCSSGLNGRNHFAVIITGVAELLSRLSLRVFEPLRQRITVYSDLKTLTRQQTSEYIRHRIQSAGVQQDLIVGEALTLIHEVSGGVPRLIDKLAHEALHQAARERAAGVALDHVHKAARTALGRTVEADT